MGAKGAELTSDIDFIKTPAAKPAEFATGEDCGIPLTNSAAIHNAPLPADGPGNEGFSNYLLAAVLIGVPAFLTYLIGQGWKTWTFFAIVLVLPLLVAFWTYHSTYSPRTNSKVKLPGRPVEHYITFKREEDKAKWSGKNKVPLVTFAEMYLDGHVTFNGDILEILEYRHDWANFSFTPELFKFIVFTFFIDVLFHTKAQDDAQIRPNYDSGNDHYAWFLGPRMIYTSGIISDTEKEETLEELQDNKMAIVCEKIELKEGETMLDIGCGWGTLARFASLNYGAKVTGLTIAENQTAWGNDALRQAGVTEEQSRIVCMDYRDIPRTKYDKITQLEMGEHVGIRKLTTFFRQCYDMLNDDGAMYVQLSGLRQAWQYEDFIWGLYLNKYIFRGADASTPLWYYVKCLEQAGFELKGIDTVGVHYSGTLWRWYRNWVGNVEAINAKYGARWYRIWELFLAWSVIASREGMATCYQMVVVKNLNSTHRVNGIASQYSLEGALAASRKAGKSKLPQ
ncbi:Sphingolipid C9-methyltransferase 1 [Penicillium cosmopolitanum]|uniref:sphingolipid C(9)-methyltransferase n=1 Tax=Penicillium cosmopolitanum TaxID=1131564 RepID=A0A9W9VHE3_9EURO|nr:Sphingolipid C9-methyltransferase 1 [Penicillium cosmopolitanum]XP_057126817.1 Sphingolipid C9-methyltransferase 1 [Penicillium waksmanii]KAJ5379540.1 Sphingolipid C9-methyltransferase 1 [Penicillium cosmopolitanum]KAJ5995689.1 Sphingolipid C9-methyltransferase 1 [Penicillium waksmanii]